MKSRNRTVKIIVFLTLVVLSLVYLLPIYVMVTTSLKSIEEINRGNYLSLSGNPQFSNYREVLFGSAQFRSHMLPRLINSCIISFSVTFLSALFGSLGGYYLSRTRTTFARVLFVLVGIALYLPYQAVIIPLVIFMARTKLALTYWGLIGAYLILNVPLASVLMGTFFLSIPRELEEAAEVDGASKIQTFFRVIVPISLPAYASVAIIVFTQVWNEFFLALSLSSPKTQTVQVVMAEAKGTTLVFYNLQMAAALIAVAIPLLFFLLLGRYFIRGILAGALKG
ncbi:MAG: carbohydrate ABC transporter permease [Anaerolineales bacterium]|nr:carbohydrate ABC transporter permease [Anaerolineales bacterium]MCS7248754.1 carbohydrate ABC transporter permease [Anaerolineales bacterium]MDW8162567.1 carbohydrate ABC transporter permease [Anaerolineales bacterium]MDW8446472.1 carbohydrate ABC transporter permease [Anaerolineales bacterium]